MLEKIMGLARVLTGAGEDEEALLESLCRAAETLWTGRLREDAGDCGEALCCAAAFTAAADLAADCESGYAAAAEVLLAELPSGIRGGELAWEGLHWEKETGMFLRRGNLRCQAVFVARSGGDEETFLDFILKGVMKH